MGLDYEFPTKIGVRVPPCSGIYAFLVEEEKISRIPFTLELQYTDGSLVKVEGIFENISFSKNLNYQEAINGDNCLED